MRRGPGDAGADVVVAVAAAAYLASSFLPGWYRVGGGDVFGLPIPGISLDAWGGPTIGAPPAAMAALAWLVLRRARRRERRAAGSAVDVALAGVALVLTLLGLALPRPSALGPARFSWLLLVGVGLALAWLYGALWGVDRDRDP